MSNQQCSLRTGWAQTDITPDEKVYLAGQHYARISEGVLDPVTATALVIESIKAGETCGHVVMISCDIVGIADELRDAVRENITTALPEIDTKNIFFNATHTHAAPTARYKKRYVPDNNDDSSKEPPFGIELEAMDPEAYVKFAAERIADAVEKAWENRQTSGIAYGVGHAVVGRNRRLSYKDGSSRMYGSAETPDFSHFEGYEDHTLQALMTYDTDKKLTGIVANVPCPSQVSENSFRISADYWHETRRELRRRFGDGIHILAQCAPAGDQSPHVLTYKEAQKRMWRLSGTELGRDRSRESSTPRDEIARRIADAVEYILPAAEKDIDWAPEFAHKAEVVKLPRRKITAKDVEDISAEKENYRKEYESLLEELEQHPEKKGEARWYVPVTRPYKKMKWVENVEKRLELQKTQPDLPMELHVVRLGDIAFATNPFELYLDYGIRMRELSNAAQTFLVQLAGPGSYLPSERTLAGGGYGSVPASTDIGPEGGEVLVDWTVKTINDLAEE